MTLRPLPTKSILALAVASLTAAPALAVPLYWNPAPLSNTWDTTALLFATAPGGTPDTAWVDTVANDAVFDRNSEYVVTLAANRTAGAVAVTAGDVTFNGTSTTLTANTLTVGTGAVLRSSINNFFKTGTTAVVVDGTFNNNTANASGRLFNFTGTGTLNSTNVRVASGVNFAGTFADFTAGTVRAGINTNGFAGGVTTFSGDIGGATGEFYISPNNRLVLAGAASLNLTAGLRLEAGAAASNALTNTATLELAGGNLVRLANFATTPLTAGAGQTNVSGDNAGFSAVGGNRTVTFVTSATDATPATISYGAAGFNPSRLILANGNATGTLTFVNPIALTGTATRAFAVADGTAAVDAELPAVISGPVTAAFGKTGAGRLVVGGVNTFLGNVVMTGAGTSVGLLRPTNNEAFGPDAAVKNVDLTASTGNSTGGVELTGGLTFNNKNLRLGGRTVGANFGALINASGDNAWNGSVLIGGAGGGYSLRSDGGTLTLGGPVANEISAATAGTRVFNLFGAGNYNVTGVVRNGNTATGTNINGTTALTYAGTGTATLSGPNTYTGATTVQGGVVRATVPAYTNTVLGTGTGGLDVQGGRFEFVYTESASPVAQVKAILDAGYAEPAKFSTGPIRSTTLAAGRTLGYADTGSAVVIAVTIPGDADLNGQVDFADFVALQSSFGGTDTRFDQGNFDYDGDTDFADFVALQSNFGQSINGGRVAIGRAEYDRVMGISSAAQVPEPVSLAVAGLTAAGLLRRRRA